LKWLLPSALDSLSLLVSLSIACNKKENFGIIHFGLGNYVGSSLSHGLPPFPNRSSAFGLGIGSSEGQGVKGPPPSNRQQQPPAMAKGLPWVSCYLWEVVSDGKSFISFYL
jgi:hypothetical protein